MTILSDYKAGKGSKMDDDITQARLRLKEIVVELREVLDDEDIDWEEKYDLVFDTNKEVVRPLLETAVLRLDYYDPDTTYKEDARAYVSALEELVEQCRAW